MYYIFSILYALLFNERGAVTIPLITNWLWVQYLKTNEINKQLSDGSVSPLYQSVAVKMKKNDHGGKDYTIPQWKAQKATTSRDSQTSFDRNAAGATGDRATFIHQMVENFDYVIIDRQARLASSNTNAGTFFETLKSDADQSVMKMNTDITQSLYGGAGDGAVGVVKDITGSVVTLEENTAIQNFEKGQWLEFAAAKYGGTDNRRVVDTSTKIAQITKIDRYKLKFTLDNVTNIADDDLIWKEGDYLKSGDAAQHVGLTDYSPSAIAGTDSFLKMNRSTDPARLAGYYELVNNSSSGTDHGDRLLQALVRASVRVSKIFPMFASNKICVNPEIMIPLTNSYLRTQIRWIEKESEMKKTATYGFSAFYIQGPKGKIAVVLDPFCPQGEIHGIYENALELRYLSYKKGMVVAFKTEGDGGRIQVDQTGKNRDIMQLESYTFMANYLPGSFFKLDVKAIV